MTSPATPSPLHDDGDANEVLVAAWARFCDRLLHAGEHALKQPDASPQEKAEAFRHLLSSVGQGFDRHMQGDPLFPHLLRLFTPNRKQAGDNASGLYLRAVIDGQYEYRVVGRLGGAPWVAFTVSEPQPEPPHPGQAGYRLVGDPLLRPNLVTDADGRFELILSPNPHPGNWLRTTPTTRSLLVRQFFGDWAAEDPMDIRIERIGAAGEAPPLLTPDVFAARLEEVGDFVFGSAEHWPDGTPQWRRLAGTTNTFAFHVTAPTTEARTYDINAGGVSAYCHWHLGPDEALLIEFAPPQAYYWSVDLLNYWYATPDYRYRQTHLNSSQARVDADGTIRMVVSTRDPGHANWLDTSGWREGIIELRAVACAAPFDLNTRVLPLANLSQALAPHGAIITPEERRQVLAQRAEGVRHRFRDF